MTDRAIPEPLAERFLRGETDRAENRAVVRALLLERDARLAPPPRPAEERYDRVFDRALRAAAAEDERLAADKRRAARLADELAERLDREPLASVRAAVSAEKRWHSWALGETLRHRSFDAGLEDPERAVELAELAVAAAEAAADGTPLDHDLVAAAFSQLGNALRIVSDLRGAREAFDTAARHLDRGTRDPLARARLLSYEASLAWARSRHEDGIALCRRAARLFRRAGDPHARSRMLIQEADFHGELGAVAAAVACLDRAIAGIETEREPRLVLVLLHNLIAYLDRDGRYDEAWQRLDEARRLAAGLGHRLDRVRLRWLEGRIAMHRGLDERAERRLREARETFIELGVDFDAALVSLELAALLAGAERHAELRELVEETVPVFESRELHDHAQAALKIFCDAVRAEAADAALLAREVFEYLRRSRRRPARPFRAG